MSVIRHDNGVGAKGEHRHRRKEQEYKEIPSAKKDQEGEEYKRPRFLSNHTHYSKTDREARISVKPGKPRQLNYGMQTAVDMGSHVITYAGASSADRRDSECLAGILDATISNLKENGLELEEITADSGYSSGSALQACEDRGVRAFIPNHGSYKPQRDGFTNNEEEDSYSCIRGVKLPFTRLYQDEKGYYKKQYRSRSKDCKDCPLKSECIKGKRAYKKIEQTYYKPLYDKMHGKLQTKYRKEMKKGRQSTVEPVLGTLINFMGVKRIWTRGLSQANKFIMGAAIAYNIKKWLNHKTKKVGVQVMEAKSTLKAAFFSFAGVPYPAVVVSSDQQHKG